MRGKAVESLYEVRWLEGDGVKVWRVEAASWASETIGEFRFMVFRDAFGEVVLAVRMGFFVSLCFLKVTLRVKEETALPQPVVVGNAV